MRIRLIRLTTSRCRHLETIVVRSTGMERTVCENCGHVSFSFDADIVGMIDQQWVAVSNVS